MTQTLSGPTRARAIAQAADRVRHHALDVGEVQCQGYVGLALGLADVPAAAHQGAVSVVAEPETYGSGDSRIPMSGMSTDTPGTEISGGSLGHGLGLAVGMALGLGNEDEDARAINLMSGGELDEDSTREAARAASHHRLGRLLGVVDGNGLQADGPTPGVLRTEPAGVTWAGLAVEGVR